MTREAFGQILSELISQAEGKLLDREMLAELNYMAKAIREAVD